MRTNPFSDGLFFLTEHLLGDPGVLGHSDRQLGDRRGGIYDVA